MKYAKTTRQCASCNSTITRSPSLMKGKNIFCNRKCQKQYYQDNTLTGPDNPNWKGGTITTELGYIRKRQPNHFRAVNGYVLEHIIVMEKKLSRPLKKNERIHHIDHNPANNHPDNLKLYASNGQHLKEEGHHRKKHPPCKCGRKHKGHGFCTRHLRQFRKTGITWDFENDYLNTPKPGEKVGHRFATLKVCPCGKKSRSRGLCSRHYRQLLRHGKVLELGIKSQ